MRFAYRIERLEAASSDAEYRYWGERLAEEFGLPNEWMYRELLAIHERIQRNGLDGEIRRIARESGHPEEQVWSDFEEALAKVREG